jgi:hypothetical protein
LGDYGRRGYIHAALLQPWVARIAYFSSIFAWRDSIAPLSSLGGPQLVHLLHALLELDVLALFVRMSLVLQRVLAIDPLTNFMLNPVSPSIPRNYIRRAAHGRGPLLRTSHFHGR